MAGSVAVVIPVYNEERTIESVIQQVLLQPCVREVVVVDDCSTDGTARVLDSIRQKLDRVKTTRHAVNQGKGAALRTGFALAAAPIVLVQDADLEYDPADYERLIQPIVAGKADVVFGSRFLGQGAHRVLYYWHSVGNRVLTHFSNVFTNLNLSDMECGYKVFSKPVLDRLRIEEERFGFEPEIVCKVARLGVRVYEVPISYHGRTYAEGKKIGWRDGVRAFYSIVKFGLRGQ